MNNNNGNPSGRDMSKNSSADSSMHTSDFEGIRRPARAVSESQASGNAQNSVRTGAVPSSGAPRRSAGTKPTQGNGGNTAPKRTEAETAKNSQPKARRAVANQKENGEARRDAAKKASTGERATARPAQRRTPVKAQSSDTLSHTRDIDKERLKRAKDADMEDEEEVSEGEEGGSAVMSLIKAILYIIIVVAVAGLLSYYVIVFANDMYAFVKSSEEVEVSIPEYATVEEIADILGDANIVKYPELLVLYAKLKKIDKTYEFIAGDYTVNGMMNYDELFLAFVKQKSYEVVRITIPEGYTVDEMIKLFTENGIGTRDGFVDVINNYPFDYEFVKALENVDTLDRIYRLEGYLYPDTYEFYKSSSEVTVISKLLSRFNVIFSSDFYEKAEKLGYSVDEIMTLASMIEKEARYSQDYELVSSVFHNRLKSPNFPRMESDATIMYAIQVRDGERKTHLTGEDLEYDTPYNSYMYEGLPPGPIANPGYEAITCALWPASTKYYYFVSDNYGNTYFSKTLAEHNAAKAKVAEINASAS